MIDRKKFDDITAKKRPTLEDLEKAQRFYYSSSGTDSTTSEHEQLYQCAKLHYLQALHDFMTEHEFIHGLYEIDVIQGLIEITLDQQAGKNLNISHVTLKKHWPRK